MSRRGTPRKTINSSNTDDQDTAADSVTKQTPTKRSSSSASRQSTPQRPSVERGPLPALNETLYHKRLHIEGSLRHVKARASQQTISQVNAGYVYRQGVKLQQHVSNIDTIVLSLSCVVDTMMSVCDRAEQLVIEASKSNGNQFAFRDPLWVTWPLAKFADGLTTLTIPYRDSLVLIESLLDTLLTFPKLPDAPTASSTPFDTAESKDNAASESPLEHLMIPAPFQRQQDASSDSLERRRGARPSSESVQACMSMLAVQPLLPGKDREQSVEAWEELMALEIGGY
ncbi:hypothetical protein OIO90_004071 [Microbotryomycetes sp. JL221]|nr:hypothetical protein OIO90_004071 [Microbotryomycetes sp. JL221]